MSLWLVVVIQRMIPPYGPCACSSWAWPWSMTALMVSPESRVRSVLLPRRPDLTRLNDFAGPVAPGVSFVGDDGGDVGIRELLAERRHRGAPLAVQHDLDVASPGTVDELGAVKRRERSLDPQPVRRMAGDAVRRV